jgi:tetratricopeptide (TPR) repeat protein
MRSRAWWLLFFLLSLLLGGVLLYNLPPVNRRLAWRVDEMRAQIKYALSPPEQVVFVPQENTTTDTLTPEPTNQPDLTPAIPPFGPTTTSTSSPSPTLLPTPVPGSVQLSGFRHEYQGWNNCGPATLSIALSYWSWEGDQNEIALITKPNPRDKNVMPYELADFVDAETPFKAVFRVGGEIELLKRFLAAGLPVIIEKGFEGPNFDGWMGHYVLVTGYTDLEQTFTLQDSYYGPDQVMGYMDLERFWRAFNFTYLVVYPPERNADIMALLGTQADKTFNDHYTAQKASDEITSLTGRDQYFAWFNRGTSQVALQDYAGAAAAYDQAFSLYPSISEKERPWRMMWYQTGPYWAYFYSGRYQDVIDLATKTLDNMSEPVLEESYYWRALAREAVGDIDGAIADLQASLEYHTGFEPGLTQLQRLGVSVPSSP